MEYIKQVLLPDEEIIFIGKVHPVLYYPGIFCFLLALAAAKFLPGWGNDDYNVSRLLYKIQHIAPLLSHTPEIISISLFVIGIFLIVYAYMITFSTEVAITDRRIIAKFGIYNTTTTEIDRRKIAGVIIRQGPIGKMLDFGNIILRGYSGDISGLPPMSKPFDFQKHVNARVRY